MQKLSNYIAYSVLTLSSLIFTGCGGSSGGDSSSSSNGVLINSGSTNTTTVDNSLVNTNVNDQTFTSVAGEAAPNTLDATSFQPASSGDNMIFHFSRLAGSGTAADPETGFANSISDIDGNYSSVNLELPKTITNIGYQYVKTGPFTGTIVINGDPTLDGTGDPVDSGENGPSPHSDTVDVMTTSPLGTFFVTFGTNGQEVSQIAVEASNMTTNERELVTDADGNIIEPLQTTAISPAPTVIILTNTANSGANIVLQDGNPIPVGYTSQFAATIPRVTPQQIFPLDLADAGTLLMNYTDVGRGEVRSLFLYGATSTSLSRAEALDQGIYRMNLNVNGNDLDSTGNTIAPGTIDISYDNDVQYFWQEVPNTADQATLDIVYNDHNSGGADVTEIYLFTFTSFEDGTFIRTQPADGTAGTFQFPNVDETN